MTSMMATDSKHLSRRLYVVFEHCKAYALVPLNRFVGIDSILPHTVRTTSKGLSATAGDRSAWTADCPFVDSDPQALSWSVDIMYDGLAPKRYGRGWKQQSTTRTTAYHLNTSGRYIYTRTQAPENQCPIASILDCDSISWRHVKSDKSLKLGTDIVGLRLILYGNVVFAQHLDYTRRLWNATCHGTRLLGMLGPYL